MASRPRIRCIFCQGFGLSREHIIPDWVQQIIPKKPTAGQNFTLRTTLPSDQPPGFRPRHTRSRVRQGHPISRKVKVVCKRCNTGWLSALEEELKLRLTSLVIGMPLTLTPWDQRRLATWAAKTAMTAEFLHPKSAAITFEEREYLRLHREPPKAFNVWAAHYNGSRYKTEMHHHSVYLSAGVSIPPKTKTPNTQTTLLGLGQLFLQVSSSSWDGLQINLKDESVSNLRRIWPPRDVDLTWPPPASLGDQDIDFIRAGLNAAFAENA